MVNYVECEDQNVDSEARDRRLKSLSNFQAMILRHSLKFPSVRRVVYSTCSIYEQENELVIQDVLQSTYSAFQLVDIVPELTSRGKSSTLLQAERCVRLSPETSLTEGFFIACLERVEVPAHSPSTEELKVGDQSTSALVVSKSICGEMQIENDAADDDKKSHRRKNSKKEKAAKLKPLEVDVTMVDETSISELGEQSEKSLSGNVLFIPELMAATLDTEHDTVEEKRKSHKRKKSKNEKAAKIAKLKYSETDVQRLDHVQNSPDAVICDVEPTEEHAVSDGRKFHKHKKSKKSKAVKQFETTRMDEERSQIKADRLAQKSFSEDTSCAATSEAELDMVEEKIKSHKRKKSTNEKVAEVAKPKHSETDVQRLKDVQNSPSAVICDVEPTEQDAASDRKKFHNHKKSKKDRTVKQLETTGGDEERSEIKPDMPTQKSFSEDAFCVATLEAERDTAEKNRKSRKHKKSKNEKAAKAAKLKQSETDIQLLDHVQNSPDTMICDAVPTEQDAASDRKKFREHKKSKKDKTIRQLETTGSDEERSEIKPESLTQNSFGEDASCVCESTDGIVQGNCGDVRESKKRHKHKKSKREKAEK